MKYKSNPIEIEVEKFEGKTDKLVAWLKEHDPQHSNHYWDSEGKLWIKPTSGLFNTVKQGYFIIRERSDFSGFYPCNPEIFFERYSKISF